MESKFGKDGYVGLFPALSAEKIEKYVPIIVTYILLCDNKQQNP